MAFFSSNISTVYDRLMRTANLSLDLKKAVESWNSNDRWGSDALTNYKNLVTSFVPGNAPALLAAAESFGIDIARFADNQDPNESFDLSINLAQSFGGLIQARVGRISLRNPPNEKMSHTLKSFKTLPTDNASLIRPTKYA